MAFIRAPNDFWRIMWHWRL